jgi:hypothetical protein
MNFITPFSIGVKIAILLLKLHGFLPSRRMIPKYNIDDLLLI